MLSRRLPFSGLHGHAILYLSAKGQRPEDNGIDDEFRGSYRMLYEEMWSQDAAGRPTTNEVISKLDALIVSKCLF